MTFVSVRIAVVVVVVVLRDIAIFCGGKRNELIKN
jgi:hypothetical protein